MLRCNVCNKKTPGVELSIGTRSAICPECQDARRTPAPATKRSRKKAPATTTTPADGGTH